jgi:Ca2+-binding EF-hand superfamily protein
MATLEDRLDMLEQNLRHKMDVMTGFAEDAVKAKKCEDMFKYFDKNGSGEIDLEEFFLAMTQLNFVGVQVSGR